MRGRLMLLPGLRRVWRDENTLQLGTNPAHALVIEVGHRSVARILDLLDGSRTMLGVVREAAERKVPEETVSELVDTLRAGRLLLVADELLPSAMTEPVRRRIWPEAAAIALGRLSSHAAAGSSADAATASGAAASGRVPRPVKPAEALRRRDEAWVLISGPSRLSGPLASILAASGIGHIDTVVSGRVGVVDFAVGGAQPADLERPRRSAVADAVRRVAPETDTRSIREGAATFMVQIGLSAPSELVAFRYARQRLPHLLIEERDGAISVGPLVRASGRPCINCVDLHRRDRDPAWPAIIAQLSTASDAPFPTAMATTMVAAGVAAGQVLSYVDTGSAATIGASFEINGSPQHRRRTWAPHPRCDCMHRHRSRIGMVQRYSRS